MSYVIDIWESQNYQLLNMQKNWTEAANYQILGFKNISTLFPELKLK